MSKSWERIPWLVVLVVLAGGSPAWAQQPLPRSVFDPPAMTTAAEPPTARPQRYYVLVPVQAQPVNAPAPTAPIPAPQPAAIPPGPVAGIPFPPAQPATIPPGPAAGVPFPPAQPATEPPAPAAGTGGNVAPGGQGCRSCSGKGGLCRRVLNHFGIGCWAHHDQYGCSSFMSECRFVFGSCRAYFGQRCSPDPPPVPTPPGYYLPPNYWR